MNKLEHQTMVSRQRIFTKCVFLQTFYAHRLVLAAYSPHFANLLRKHSTHKSGVCDCGAFSYLDQSTSADIKLWREHVWVLSFPGSTASQSLMLKVDFVKEVVLVRLLDFMYRGYLEVHGVDLQQLLTGAQMLR